MHYYRGDCGHIKARWDNHYSCQSCTSCSRFSTCYICSQWSDDVWILAEKRRLHTTRRLVMTTRRQNKKKNRNVSDPSDTISLDGRTAPHGFTARGRTHLGGSQMETNRPLSHCCAHAPNCPDKSRISVISARLQLRGQSSICCISE